MTAMTDYSTLPPPPADWPNRADHDSHVVDVDVTFNTGTTIVVRHQLDAPYATGVKVAAGVLSALLIFSLFSWILLGAVLTAVVR